MLRKLPLSLNVGGKDYPIRTDYRDCLLILDAFNDPDLSWQEQYMVMLQILYKEVPGEEHIKEAIDKALWFLNLGEESSQVSSKPVFSWEQDEQMIFAEVNKIAGREIRLDEYMHFWTFMGFFQCIGEGLFSTVISIRQKLNSHKKLDKTEKEFYKKNKQLVDLKKRVSTAEQQSIDLINQMYT